MCGINGLYNLAGHSLQDEPALIRNMNACIRHRGPDDSGTWTEKKNRLVFGHLRLSIIDLSPTGHQPMISEQGNVIVFNGEIYNYKELKKDIKEHSFKSSSDTEVMLCLYEKYGQRCLDHFNGMFAFALWDEKKEELFLARDRAGKKPLYYTTQGGIFAFSSEIKALLTLPWIKRELDEKALYHFLTFNILPPPLTMFKNIFKFHPGHKMTVNKSGIKNYEPYWEIEYTDLTNDSEASLENKIFDGLTKSVDYRMVADVPVGAFLSGGVDSSAVVALMSRVASSPVKTYSIGFENQPGYDELIHAQKISKSFNTEHYEKIVTAADMREFLPRVVDIFDEPVADTTSIPIYFLSQLAREKGTIVVLTGDGADEQFAGYNSYLNYKKYYPLFRHYSNLPGIVKKISATAYSMFDDSSPAYEMMHRAAIGQEFFQSGVKSFKESVKNKFLSNDFKARNGNLNSYEVIESYKKQFDALKSKNNFLTDLDWMCFIGTKFIVPNLYLMRSDKLGMAHSIETRAPFLDKDFINLALSVPAKYKIQNNIPKSILKKSLEKILPHEVLYRKKMGFCVPIKEWGSEIMVDYLDTHLKSFCANTGFFDETNLKKLLNGLKQGDAGNNTNNLWTIYFLMGWLKKWMNA